MTEEQKKDLVIQANQLPPRAMEIAQQLKLMVSNGQKLAPEEILTLASFAYREGLDPLNGECWYIKSKGCMVGIKGLRRKATEALGYEDVWYPEYKDITQTYDIKDVEILYAYECTIRNTRATARWLRLQEEAKPLNFTSEQTIEAFGHPPVWVGVGVIRKNEYASPTYPQRTRCKKRAEAAAINAMMGFGYDVMDEDQRAPVEIQAIEEESPQQDDSIEAEFTPTETTESETSSEEEQKSVRPYPAQEVRENIQKLAQKYIGRVASEAQKHLLVGMLDMCFVGSSKEISDMKRHQVCSYLTGEASSKKILSEYVIAILDWLKPTQDSGGAYMPDPMAVKEVGAILEAQVVESGQEKLI